MAVTARIDELRRKFDENPRRYFAHLANEYRKAGDLETAIAICRRELAAYPDHVSGHIVLGQALFEAGRRTEARGVFEAALGLDPENLIGLRHLGDIAREEGDDAAARHWYGRILEADPRNDDVAELLGTVAGAREAARFAPPSQATPQAAPQAAPAAPPSAASGTPPVAAPGGADEGFVGGWDVPAFAAAEATTQPAIPLVSGPISEAPPPSGLPRYGPVDEDVGLDDLVSPEAGEAEALLDVELDDLAVPAAAEVGDVEGGTTAELPLIDEFVADAVAGFEPPAGEPGAGGLDVEDDTGVFEGAGFQAGTDGVAESGTVAEETVRGAVIADEAFASWLVAEGSPSAGSLSDEPAGAEAVGDASFPGELLVGDAVVGEPSVDEAGPALEWLEAAPEASAGDDAGLEPVVGLDVAPVPDAGQEQLGAAELGGAELPAAEAWAEELAEPVTSASDVVESDGASIVAGQNEAAAEPDAAPSDAAPVAAAGADANAFAVVEPGAPATGVADQDESGEDGAESRAAAAAEPVAGETAAAESAVGGTSWPDAASVDAAHGDPAGVDAAAADAGAGDLLDLDGALIEAAPPGAGGDEAPAARPAPVVHDDAHVDAEELSALTSGAFATETLAELFVDQGHLDQAIAIYERLITERPGEAGLRQRLREVQRMAGVEPAAEAAVAEMPELPASGASAAFVAPTAGAYFAALATRAVGYETRPETPLAAAEAAAAVSAAPAVVGSAGAVRPPVSTPARAATDQSTVDAIFAARSGTAPAGARETAAETPGESRATAESSVATAAMDSAEAASESARASLASAAEASAAAASAAEASAAEASAADATAAAASAAEASAADATAAEATAAEATAAEATAARPTAGDNEQPPVGASAADTGAADLADVSATDEPAAEQPVSVQLGTVQTETAQGETEPPVAHQSAADEAATAPVDAAIDAGAREPEAANEWAPSAEPATAEQSSGALAEEQAAPTAEVAANGSLETDRATGDIVTAESDGTATLLAGPASADDERAAGRLAGAFSTAPEAGPSLLDDLAERASAAEAAPETEPGAPNTAPTETSAAPSSAEPAPDDLSFDRFFAGFEDLLSSPAAQTAEHEVPLVAAEDVSGAAESTPTAAPATAEAPQRAGEPADDDLAQFNAWLKGLGDL